MHPAEKDTNQLHIGARHRRAVLRHSGLSSTQRLIAVAVGEYADKTGKAWPSLKTLAVDTGLSRFAVGRNLETIEKAGWLKVDRRGANRWQNKFGFELSFGSRRDAESRLDSSPDESSRRDSPCSRRDSGSHEVEKEVEREPSGLLSHYVREKHGQAEARDRGRDAADAESENHDDRRAERTAVEEQDAPGASVSGLTIDAQSFSGLGDIEPPRPKKDASTRGENENSAQGELERLLAALSSFAPKPSLVRFDGADELRTLSALVEREDNWLRRWPDRDPARVPSLIARNVAAVLCGEPPF